MLGQTPEFLGRPIVQQNQTGPDPLSCYYCHISTNDANGSKISMILWLRMFTILNHLSYELQRYKMLCNNSKVMTNGPVLRIEEAILLMLFTSTRVSGKAHYFSTTML